MLGTAQSLPWGNSITDDVLNDHLATIVRTYAERQKLKRSRAAALPVSTLEQNPLEHNPTVPNAACVPTPSNSARSTNITQIGNVKPVDFPPSFQVASSRREDLARRVRAARQRLQITAASGASAAASPSLAKLTSYQELQRLSPRARQAYLEPLGTTELQKLCRMGRDDRVTKRRRGGSSEQLVTSIDSTGPTATRAGAGRLLTLMNDDDDGATRWRGTDLLDLKIEKLLLAGVLPDTIIDGHLDERHAPRPLLGPAGSTGETRSPSSHPNLNSADISTSDLKPGSLRLHGYMEAVIDCGRLLFGLLAGAGGAYLRSDAEVATLKHYLQY
jgi:hypothetical protein